MHNSGFLAQEHKGGRDEDAIDRSEGGPGEILGGIAGETLALDTMNLKWDQSFSL